MDKWINKRMNGQIDGRMSESIDRELSRYYFLYLQYTVNIPDVKRSQEVSINEARRLVCYQMIHMIYCYTRFRYRTTITGETQEHRRSHVRQSRKPASDERRK